MQGLIEFGYLCDVATKYGVFYFAHEFESFIRDATDQQVRELAIAYESIRRQDDAHRISRWIDQCLHQRSQMSHAEYTFSQQLGQMLLLFQHLGRNRISPFSSGEVCYVEKPKVANWSNLPNELSYLIEPAIAFGKYASEEKVIDFLDQADPEDVEVLAHVAERIRMNGDIHLINNWFNQFPIDQYQEARLVYWLFAAMDHAGLSWQ